MMRGSLALSETDEELIARLRRLEGVYPAGRAHRLWRLFFLVYALTVFPLLSAVVVAEQLAEGNFDFMATASAAFLTISHLWFGYLMYRDHRYEVRDKVISSLGRRLLWSLPLDDVRSARQSGDGNWGVVWPRTGKYERGLVLYPSIRAALDGDSEA